MRGDAFFMEMASRPPFSRLHPRLAAFFKEYLSNEKVHRFDERFVVNVHLPPFPGFAFDRMVSQFDAIGEAGSERKLFSVTWALTNRCPYQCWHCYNAGRKQEDVQLATLRGLAAEMNDLGACGDVEAWLATPCPYLALPLLPPFAEVAWATT